MSTLRFAFLPDLILHRILRKSFCAALLISAAFSPSFAQETPTAVIGGKVVTSDGQPAAGVSISLKGSNRGSATDANGKYRIPEVGEGTYTVSASAVGMEPVERTVTVGRWGVYTLDFTLVVSAEQLKTVVVTSGRDLNQEDRFVAKMPLKNLENPQVYSMVSAEILKQQAVVNYNDAMRNVPGLVKTWEATGRAGDGAAYFALRGFDAQPFLTNGLPGLVSGNLDPANVESIQVLKGPSGTLFGGSFYSYGGIINTITKKPYFTTGGEIAYNFGSFGLNRITADINTPLSKEEKIALRVNAAYHSENSFQDAGFKKSFFIAPSLVYEASDRLSFHFDAEILEEERAVPPVFFHSDRANPLPFKTLEELNLNDDLSFTSNELTIKNPRYILQGQMLYELSDKWTSQTIFSRGTVKSNGIYTYIWDDASGDNYFDQTFRKVQQTINTTVIQQNFNGDFSIGNMRNRLLVGLDFYHRNMIDNSFGWERGRSVTPQGDVRRYVNPSTGDTTDLVQLTLASVDKLLADIEPMNSNISNSSYSAYVSNVLNITPGLTAMLSLRADYFDSKGDKNTDDDDYDQFALSPKLGLVYQPVLNELAVFASYMDAFINIAPAPVFDEDENQVGTRSFKPEHATQLEFGVKANLLSDKLFGTLSVYNIEVSDRVYPDPANINNSVQGGKVRSRGFEVDITANPAAGFNLIAGYSYNEIETVEGNPEDFYTEPGRSPGGQGPQNLANFWATYTFTQGKMKNFGIGLGGNYGSEYKVIDNSQTGDFYLPAYTLLNASLFYNPEKFRIAFNVNNLNNEVYYSGYWSVNPQSPRNFVASFAYKF